VAGRSVAQGWRLAPGVTPAGQRVDDVTVSEVSNGAGGVSVQVIIASKRPALRSLGRELISVLTGGWFGLSTAGPYAVTVTRHGMELWRVSFDDDGVPAANYANDLRQRLADRGPESLLADLGVAG